MKRRIVERRDIVRLSGFAVGSIFILIGAFKPVEFSVSGQGTNNALVFSGLFVIAIALIGTQIAKYVASKIK